MLFRPPKSLRSAGCYAALLLIAHTSRDLSAASTIVRPIEQTLNQTCTSDTWTATTMTGAPIARSNHAAVWTGNEMIVWGGNGSSGNLNTGGRYNPVADSWIPTATTNAPEGRQYYTAVWTGSEMIVWGDSWADSTPSLLGTGARYNPANDTWVPMSATTGLARRGYFTAIWTGTEMIIWGGTFYDGTTHFMNTGARYSPVTNTWAPISTLNAPVGRQRHSAIWTGTEMIVWGGTGLGSELSSGGKYNPATDTWMPISTTNSPGGRAAHSAVWAGNEMIVWGGATNGLSNSLNTGGKYDPNTDTWMATSTSNAPSARDLHTAIWTGTEMIVWGGYGCCATAFNTGGKYNPETDTWTATSVVGGPGPRGFHTAVWTGSEMILWGGNLNGPGPLGSGGRYCAQSPIPTPTPQPTPPMTVIISGITSSCVNLSRVTGVTLDLTGDVQGKVGSDAIGNYGFFQLPFGGTYSVRPTKSGLSPGSVGINTVDVIAAQRHFLSIRPIPPGCGLTTADVNHDGIINTLDVIAIQRFVLGLATGTADVGKYNFIPASRTYSTVTANQFYQNYESLIVGDVVSQFVQDCSDDTWTPVSTIGAPTCRNDHTQIWTGHEMIVWGGIGGWTPPGNTGGRYIPGSDTWSATSTVNAPAERVFHTAIWTGREMIVWGGYPQSSVFLNDGGKYDPTTDTWTVISSVNAPSPRFFHTAIWTGREMIVWGGNVSDTVTNTGGKYNPLTDTWTPISTNNAPLGRTLHTATWTGSEMIVWGGANSTTNFNTGGRYNPATDSWTALSINNAPIGRALASAVWTGQEMLIWGGGADSGPFPNAVGRYNPSTDSWVATSAVDAPVGRTWQTAIWTGREMIVWGGWVGGPAAVLNSGGRYNPVTDTWGAIGLTNAPGARYHHRAIWTGSEMIIWGGTDCGPSDPSTGAAYCAGRE